MGAWWQMIVVVLIWWVANGITSIASKSMMVTHGTINKSVASSSLKPAFKDFRWLELTIFQHLLGAIASVIFLKIIKGKSAAIWPTNSPTSIIWIGGCANVVGNMSTNAAYALVSSSVTQVVKSFEPIFTFFLSLLLYKNYGDLTSATLMSIVTMSAGACTFVVLDKSFNVWGLLAAISSNMGFATRNIFLKKLAWDSPVQKYAVISICSTVVLLPALLLKLIFVSASTSLLTHAQESIISAVSHFTYNTASITVLQDITPLTHATLNLSKRVFVIIANLIYFQTPVTMNMLLGLLIFFAGLSLYNFRKRAAVKEITWVVVFIAVIVCIGFQAPRLLGGKNDDSGSHSSSSMVKSGCQSAWVFDRSLSPDILENIKSWQSDEICPSIYMYCGTTQCVQAIGDLNDPHITSKFLVISKLVKSLPLQEWFVRHPLYKVLAGENFEDHLQRVVQLAILSKYGGVYVDPRIRLTGTENRIPTNHDCVNGWVHSREEFDVTCFSKQHPFIRNLSKQFVKKYRKAAEKGEFDFHFNSVLKDTFIECQDGVCPNSIVLNCNKRDDSVIKDRYGTLFFDKRVKLVHTVNLGDEIQAISGLQFLPFADTLIERDRSATLTSKEPVTSFFNAWWGDPGSDWPPPSIINPILTAVHINPAVHSAWSKKTSVDYLKRHAPVGGQDLITVEFLRKHNIDAYFSGCLTLMIKKPTIAKTRSNNIYLVDVDDQHYNLLPESIQKDAIRKTHQPGNITNGFKQFSDAFQLLEVYSSAKLIITQQMHCALPCVAMGIPVIYFGQQTESIAGLTQLFHSVDNQDPKKWLQEFPWYRPPPNPSVEVMMRMRATFWNVIRQNQALNDASHKFGMVPLQPPPVKVLVKDQLLVHLVFTASTFKWHHWRTLESIVYHYPLAKVMIHSNTLQQSEFSVLTEAGYLVKVKRYSLTQMLKDSPAEEFISKLSDAVTGQHWESHQTDLLRLLLLYKWGGIYMDNDIIIVNPVHSLKNVLTWEDPNNHTISGSFMALERDNGFLRDCLVAFVKHYDANKQTQTVNGADLLTNVWRQWMTKGGIVAMKSPLFYMFSDGDVKTECFVKSSSFDTKMKFLREEAYAVRVSSPPGETSSKLSDGTICKHVFNSFCVLCNNLY